MAAPAEINTLNLNGVFELNHDESRNLDKLLESLGIGFIKRRAIQNVNITQSIKHYKDEQGVEHIDIKGKSGRGSSRTLDWKEVEQDEPLFGEVLIKSQRLEKVESLTNSLLTEGWSADTFEFGVIHSVLRSDTVKTSKVWSADQVWGFAIVNGQRRHVRTIRFEAAEKKVVEAVLFFNCIKE